VAFSEHFGVGLRVDEFEETAQNKRVTIGSRIIGHVRREANASQRIVSDGDA